ncbi:hypothetical protein N431DRAFT_463822 [Stipitochalara longipes BDJ]|nr:hypothetical protein N431DRAFT_463822 [Stipitochalara longipes BDJ]
MKDQHSEYTFEILPKMGMGAKKKWKAVESALTRSSVGNIRACTQERVGGNLIPSFDNNTYAGALPASVHFLTSVPRTFRIPSIEHFPPTLPPSFPRCRSSPAAPKVHCPPPSKEELIELSGNIEGNPCPDRSVVILQGTLPCANETTWEYSWVQMETEFEAETASGVEALNSAGLSPDDVDFAASHLITATAELPSARIMLTL